jgi:hypothetical protein
MSEILLLNRLETKSADMALFVFVMDPLSNS